MEKYSLKKWSLIANLNEFKKFCCEQQKKSNIWSSKVIYILNQ